MNAMPLITLGLCVDDEGRRDASVALSERPLRIGVSTRALFDLEDEHAVFEREGLAAYAALQRAREDLPLLPGAGLNVVERLLALNEPNAAPYVEVVLLSRNAPDASLRVFRAVESRGLPIRVGSFTGGRPLGPLVSAWDLDLFLSNDPEDVFAAADGGAAAARLGQFPRSTADEPAGEVRIALDGDAVLFGAASDLVYREHGLEAFLRHEREHAAIPMDAGPFGKFLLKVAALRLVTGRVRVALVTARSAPAHERVVQTLRAWNAPVDEAHFVGGKSKAPVLKAFAAHVFFDDQETHVLGAADAVVAGHVPGPHAVDRPVIPAVDTSTC